MTAFFIFFILFIVYLIYTGKSSLKQTKYQQRSEANRNFSATLSCPFNIENELQQKLLNPEERWPVLESISDELEEVHGAGWHEILETYDNLYDVYFYYGGALRILLAKRGYLDFVDVSGFNLNARTFNGKEYHDEHLKKLITTCRIIERELKKNYPDMSGLDLLFVPAGGYVAAEKKYVFNEEISSGKLVFEAMKPFSDQDCPLIRRLW